MDKYILPFPKVIRIEPSALCNLKCHHCPTGTIDMPRGIMSKEIFSLIVKNIENNINNVKVVILYHGGEPFINKDFIYMLKTIKNLKPDIYIKINSNGMLLTEDLAENIIKNELDCIHFSIDGISPEENNFIRRNSDYYTIVKNIKNLIKLKKKYNLSKPEILVSNVQFVEEINKNIEVINDLFSQIPEFLLNEFNEEYKNGEIEFQSLYPLVWPDLEIDSESFKIHEFNAKNSNYCDSVINTVTIRWNGDVVPCCYDLTNKCVLGNIYKDTLFSIWNNSKYIELRKSINEKAFNELCRNCIDVSSTKRVILKK